MVISCILSILVTAENYFDFLCKLSNLTPDISRAPSSVPSHITRMQTHQQSNFYHAPPVNLNPGTSSNTPYAPDRSYETIFTIPPIKSQGGHQDTMTGMPYERNSDEQHEIFSCDKAVFVLDRLNYLQKQAGESTSVVTERRFGSGFHSRSGFQLPSPSLSMRADFLEKGGQRRSNYL